MIGSKPATVFKIEPPRSCFGCQTVVGTEVGDQSEPFTDVGHPESEQPSGCRERETYPAHHEQARDRSIQSHCGAHPIPTDA